MDCNDVKVGMKVVISKLKETRGIVVNQRHLDCRKIGVIGTVRWCVPGHGGDVWWVAHDGTNEIGAYCFTEIEPAPTTVEMKVKEWEPWRAYKMNAPDLVGITEPPCKWCRAWRPQARFTDTGTGMVFDGVVCCHAKDQYRDFSCFRSNDSKKRGG